MLPIGWVGNIQGKTATQCWHDGFITDIYLCSVTLNQSEFPAD
jgi:hypothetical protein